MSPAGRTVRLLQPIEDVGEDVGGDATARVAHHGFDVRVDTLEANLDAPAPGSGLDGVREQEAFEATEGEGPLPPLLFHTRELHPAFGCLQSRQANETEMAAVQDSNACLPTREQVAGGIGKVFPPL